MTIKYSLFLLAIASLWMEPFIGLLSTIKVARFAGLFQLLRKTASVGSISGALRAQPKALQALIHFVEIFDNGLFLLI